MGKITFIFGLICISFYGCTVEVKPSVKLDSARAVENHIEKYREISKEVALKRDSASSEHLSEIPGVKNNLGFGEPANSETEEFSEQEKLDQAFKELELSDTGEYRYVVKQGDTLRSILLSHPPYGEFDLEIMEKLVVRYNRKAFRRSNRHRLLAGATLVLPDPGTLIKVVYKGSRDRSLNEKRKLASGNQNSRLHWIWLP